MSITFNTYNESLEYIRNNLKKYKLSQKELLRGELLFEETCTLLSEQYNNPELDISVDKDFLGAVYIHMTVKGLHDNPLAMDNITAESDDIDKHKKIFFASNADAFQFKTNSHAGRLRICVHKASMHLYSVLMSMLAGIIGGIAMKSFLPPSFTALIYDDILGTFSTMFMTALNAFICPIIFFSIIEAFYKTDNIDTVKRMFTSLLKNTILTGLLSAFVGAAVGLVIFNLIPISGDFASGIPVDIPSVKDISMKDAVTALIPSSLISPFISRNVFQTILLALLFGSVIITMGEAARPVISLCESFNRLLTDAFRIIVKLVPFFIFSMVTRIILQHDISVLLNIIVMLLALTVSFVIYQILSAFLIACQQKLSFVKTFKLMLSYIVVPLSIPSVKACMPVSIGFCQNELQLPDKITFFSISMGTPFNRCGSAMYYMLSAMFLLYVDDVPMTLDNLYLVMALVVMQMFFLSGLPGYVMLITMAAAQFSLSATGIALLMSVDVIMDLIATAGDSWGTILVASMMSKEENK